MSKKRNRNTTTRSGLSAFLRKPAGQLTVVAVAIIVIVLIALSGQGNQGLAREVNTDQAYQMYQSGVFVVDTGGVGRIPCAEHHADPPRSIAKPPS